MKQAELIKRILAGEALLVAEYRSGTAETIRWRDGETGRALEAVAVRHSIECGTKSIQVSERTPEGFKPENFQAPAKKGQMVVWHVTGMTTQRGVTSGTGTFEPLETDDRVKI